MNTIDEIEECLNQTPEVTQKIEPTCNEDPVILELRNLRMAVESILIFLKITNRMTEAQYRFVFSHVSQTIPREGETLDDFLTRSAIELEKKMKNLGLL